VLLPTAPRGRFGELLVAALRRYGVLPPALAPLTPAAWVDVSPLPVMRTYPIANRAELDIRL
jgi:hypothetical protein